MQGETNLTCPHCKESGPYPDTLVQSGKAVRCQACGQIITGTIEVGIETDRALVKKTPTVMSERGIDLRSMDDLARFSKTVTMSRAYKQWTDEFKVAVAVQLGMELGMSPAQSLGSFYVVRSGAPQLYGHAALALMRSHPAIKSVSVGNDPSTAWDDDEHYGYCIVERKDEAVPREERFTVAEAKRARLWPNKADDSAWAKYSEDMLMYRAIARAARRHASDVLLGVAVIEPQLPATPDGPVEPQMSEHEPMKTGEVDPALAIIEAQEVDSADTDDQPGTEGSGQDGGDAGDPGQHPGAVSEGDSV